MLFARALCDVFRESFLMLWARVFSDFVCIVCSLQKFYAIKLHVVAICEGFEVIVMLLIISDCYVQGLQLISVAFVAICKGFKQLHSLLMV